MSGAILGGTPGGVWARGMRVSVSPPRVVPYEDSTVKYGMAAQRERTERTEGEGTSLMSSSGTHVEANGEVMWGWVGGRQTEK